MKSLVLLIASLLLATTISRAESYNLAPTEENVLFHIDDTAKMQRFLSDDSPCGRLGSYTFVLDVDALTIRVDDTYQGPPPRIWPDGEQDPIEFNMGEVRPIAALEIRERFVSVGPGSESYLGVYILVRGTERFAAAEGWLFFKYLPGACRAPIADVLQ